MGDLFPLEPTMMPVISLHQPWASLCFVADPDLRKMNETRHWAFPERLLGVDLAIHAAMKLGPIEPALDRLCATAFGGDYANVLPRGAIIGIVKLSACRVTAAVRDVTTEADRIAGNFDDFTMVKGIARQRFAWRLEPQRALSQPLPAKGRQGWWQVRRELLDDLEARR